jgi:hypothetical protein
MIFRRRARSGRRWLMSWPPAVTLSDNDFPSRGDWRLNWLTIAALSSQTFSRLIRPLQKPNTRNVGADAPPVSRRPGSDPMTVPVIRGWRIIASFVVV